MEQVPGSSGALLDSNHSHFLLVDNGTEGKYGVEINLRSRFEEAVMKVKTDSRSAAGKSQVIYLFIYFLIFKFFLTYNFNNKKIKCISSVFMLYISANDFPYVCEKSRKCFDRFSELRCLELCRKVESEIWVKCVIFHSVASLIARIRKKQNWLRINIKDVFNVTV